MGRVVARVVTWSVLAVMAMGLPVSAQSNRWYDPYRRGLSAFESGNFEEAVTQLERAVAADPRASANKFVEGVFRSDYFPYYYLGVAYLRLGQLDRAQQNLERAREALPRNLVQSLNEYQQQLAALRTPKPPPVNANFTSNLRQAEQALLDRRFADAVRSFDSARAADAAEYGRQNVQARRDQAARAYALEMAAEARALLPTSINKARTLLQEANRMFPGLQETAGPLADITRREQEYQQARAGADQDIAGAAFDAARQKLEQARSAHPEQFAADGLAERLSFVTERLRVPPTRPPPPGPDIARLFAEAQNLESTGRYQEAEKAYATVLARDAAHRGATQALERSRAFARHVSDARALRARNDAETARVRLEAARVLDARRFTREGLEAELAALAPNRPNPEPTPPVPSGALAAALRQALEALVGGDPDQSIAILEGAMDQGASVAAHAYLGVAYATRALSSADDQARTSLESRALEQFRLALESQRDYRLSPRLVSPKILELFERAR